MSEATASRVAAEASALRTRVDPWELATAATFALAFLVRARHVLPAGAPVNDGGMFAAMSEDIQRAGYALPSVASYNEAGIPFAYPPLGLYLAALVDDFTPLSMLDVYWLLPLVGALLTVMGVYALARTVFEDRLIVLVGTLAFALVPRSFEWLVMGGGLTRGFGMAAALFAIAAFRVAVRDRDRRMLVVAGLLAGATFATHLEAAVFMAIGVALSAIERPRVWSIGAWAAAAGIAALATMPWWGLVVARHGLDPFLAATAHGGSLLETGEIPFQTWRTLIGMVPTDEPFFPVAATAGTLGAAVALLYGRWFLPAFGALIILTEMRALATFVVVPAALLGGFFIVHVMLPVARHALEQAPRPGEAQFRAGLVALAFLGIALYSATQVQFTETRFLRPVSDANVRAMEWVRANTSEEARFLVVPRRVWQADREGEWFPYLTDRESVSTVQGTEWIDGEFDRRYNRFYQAQVCSYQDADCLEPLAAWSGFTHIFVPAGCCERLLQSLRDDDRYTARYVAGAAIFERKERDDLWLPEMMFPSRAPHDGTQKASR